MDVLARIFGGGLQAGTPGPADDFWYGSVGTMTAAGIRVDADGAQKLSAWYRGRDILATVLAMLPFPVYERLPNDGGSEPATDHPLYDLLHDAPNDAEDSFQWRRQGMFDLIDHGHFYNWIVPGARGFADQLVRIDPTLVTEKQVLTTLPNGAVLAGRYVFDVRDPKTGLTKTFTQDEVFHLRGADGKGILDYARSSLGTALATESYAAQIYGSGTMNGGVIQNPGLLDEEAGKRMARSFLTKAGEWHIPKVLEQGSKWVANTMTPEDAQMLAQPEALGRRRRAVARRAAADAREQRSVVRERRAVRSELHHLQHGRLAVAVRVRRERPADPEPEAVLRRVHPRRDRPREADRSLERPRRAVNAGIKNRRRGAREGRAEQAWRQGRRAPRSGEHHRQAAGSSSIAPSSISPVGWTSRCAVSWSRHEVHEHRPVCRRVGLVDSG
jgi:HK97 family phage portal protein